MERSRLATAAALVGGVGVLAMVFGPIFIHLGAIAPMMGFQFFFLLGALLALSGLLLGLAGLFTTRAVSQRSGRGAALAGIVAGLIGAGAIAVGAAPGGGLPPINDISTDLSDPPAFPSDPSGRARDMSFPAGFAEQIHATVAYQDLQPIRFARPPADVLREAEQAARALDWENVSADSAAGIITGSETTRLFQFVDDVVIRVRDDGTGGSVIDMRSKSRDGRGDIGANAARIRRFFAVMPK
jgi:uncharacterized protein (DUF1499 family)